MRASLSFRISFTSNFSAGNNFSLFTGHMSFQIFLLVGHLTNWTGHNLLTDNSLKKRTQDVLVRCSVIVSDHNVKLAGHFQNLVRQCPMTDCYFQHCNLRHYFPAFRCFCASCVEWHFQVKISIANSCNQRNSLSTDFQTSSLALCTAYFLIYFIPRFPYSGAFVRCKVRIFTKSMSCVGKC